MKRPSGGRGRGRARGIGAISAMDLYTHPVRCYAPRLSVTMPPPSRPKKKRAPVHEAEYMVSGCTGLLEQSNKQAGRETRYIAENRTPNVTSVVTVVPSPNVFAHGIDRVCHISYMPEKG